MTILVTATLAATPAAAVTADTGNGAAAPGFQQAFSAGIAAIESSGRVTAGKTTSGAFDDTATDTAADAGAAPPPDPGAALAALALPNIAVTAAATPSTIAPAPAAARSAPTTTAISVPSSGTVRPGTAHQAARTATAADQTQPTDGKPGPQLASGQAATVAAPSAPIDDGAAHAATAPASKATAADIAASATTAAIMPQPAPTAGVPAAHSTVTVNDMVGSSAWQTQVGATVVWMVNEHAHSAELKVNPPDLGPVEIRVSLTGDQHDQAAVQFIAPHAATRDALEAALPRLRDMLADAGIALGNASVGGQPRYDDSSTTQQPDAADGTSSRRAAPATVTTLAAGTGNSALVDTFA